MQKFTEINTKGKLIKNKFIKIFNINFIKDPNPKILLFVKKEILSHYSQLKKNKIFLPKLNYLKIKEKKIYCSMSYEGQNLIEKGFTHKNFIENLHYLFQSLDIIYLAFKNKVYIDPHIKNFVIKNNKMKYVDIYQPLTTKYIKFRIKNSLSTSEKKIVRQNFIFFSYRYIFFHFFADLIKINHGFLKYKNLYLKILKDRYLIKINEKKFIKLIKKIKTTEIKRSNLGIFLI